MKIVLINGQNHKGSTYRIGRMLALKIASENDIAEVFLPKDMSEFCCGCVNCFSKSETLCPHYHLMKPITDLIDASDLLIFITPVYVLSCTAAMKTLLDHYAYRFMIHRPEEKMFSKQAVCIATAAGGGMKSACKVIKDSMFHWGVSKIYTYGMAVWAVSWDAVTDKRKAKIESKIGILASKILKRNVYVGLKTKFLFNIIRLVQKKGWNPADIEYWKEKGWLGNKRPWKS